MKKLLVFLALAGAAYWYVHRPPAHRYSADDVFYLRQYVSIRTDKGPIGLVPGQEVWLKTGVGHVAGKIMVSDGTETVALDPDILTHDMDEAETLQASDSQDQAALQAQITQTKQAANQKQLALLASEAVQINAHEALQASASTVGNHRTALADAPTRVGGGGGYYYGGPIYYPGASTTSSVARAGVVRQTQAAAAETSREEKRNRSDVPGMQAQ